MINKLEEISIRTKKIFLLKNKNKQDVLDSEGLENKNKENNLDYEKLENNNTKLNAEINNKPEIITEKINNNEEKMNNKDNFNIKEITRNQLSKASQDTIDQEEEEIEIIIEGLKKRGTQKTKEEEEIDIFSQLNRKNNLNINNKR